MTRKLIFIAPLAILAMLLFTVISGEIVLRLRRDHAPLIQSLA
jgi:hypothetical protein